MRESYGLTEREVEIVKLLARGLPTKQIAAELSLSLHTVRDHIKTIFGKTNVNSGGELVAVSSPSTSSTGFTPPSTASSKCLRHNLYS